MYCVQCGVKLADTEVRCPLCGTRVFHPDIFREEGERLYPAQKYPWGTLLPEKKGSPTV